MNVAEAISSVRDLATAAQEDPTKYKAALDQASKGLESAQVLVVKLQAGKAEDIHVTLTEWEDVNATLIQTAKMDNEIKKIDEGVKLDDVLATVVQVAKIAGKVGLMFLK